jgi:hypothetical protein
MEMIAEELLWGRIDRARLEIAVVVRVPGLEFPFK